MIEPRPAEEAEQPRPLLCGQPGSPDERLSAVGPRLRVDHHVLARVPDVDRREIARGDEEASDYTVLPLSSQRLGICRDAEARSTDDIETGQKRRLARFLKYSRQSKHRPCDVLIIVAMDILCIHSGR